MAKPREPVEAVASTKKGPDTDFELQVADEKLHDDAVARSFNELRKEAGLKPVADGQFRRARTPGSTTGRGVGWQFRLQYGGGDVTFARSIAYDAMDKWFREFKRDSIVRQSVQIRAQWVTKEGADTVVKWVNPSAHKRGTKTTVTTTPVPVAKGQPPAPPIKTTATTDVYEDPMKVYGGLKDYIDGMNRKFNIDAIMREAITFGKVCGLAAFFIFRDAKGEPTKLIELEPWAMWPRIDRASGEIDHWLYYGIRADISVGADTNILPPEDVLHFTNNEILGEHVGLSEIEPISWPLQARRFLLQEAIQEVAKSLWAPAGLLQIDTERQSPAAAASIINSVLDNANLAPGKFIGVNQKVTFQKLDISPDLDKLITAKENLDNELIGNFQVPRFLLNREHNVNRATAEIQALMFINGVVADDQTQYGGQLEARWYAPLVKKWCMDAGLNKAKDGTEVAEDDYEPEVYIAHVWRPIALESVIGPNPTGPQPPGGITLEQVTAPSEAPGEGAESVAPS